MHFCICIIFGYVSTVAICVLFRISGTMFLLFLFQPSIKLTAERNVRDKYMNTRTVLGGKMDGFKNVNFPPQEKL